MDKQQATEHVLTRLRAGYHQDEITEELSRLLKAPPEAISPFVAKVTASNPDVIPPSQELDETTLPGWVQSLSIQTGSDQTDQTTHSPRSMDTDLPPGLQSLINQDDEVATSARPEQSSKPQDYPDVLTEQQPNLVPASPEKAEPTTGTDESKDVDLKALRESVVNQLKKQRRQNDVIESVCHQTGWHWNKAQRFVARVKTQNHGQIQTRQNTVTIVIGSGIIIIGLVMTINGASAISDYASLGLLARTNPEVLLNIDPRSIIIAIGAAITGIGMIIGGGYGIGRALTNR
jgi:hypothetical protein